MAHLTLKMHLLNEGHRSLNKINKNNCFYFLVYLSLLRETLDISLVSILSCFVYSQGGVANQRFVIAPEIWAQIVTNVQVP